MTTNKVMEMINAIFDGQSYELTPETYELSSEFEIAFGKSEIAFNQPDGDFGAFIRNPRVAREIAAALVTWANRQESSKSSGVHILVSAPIAQDPVNNSRESWYTRTVRMMTDDTIQRNMKDLQSIEASLASNRNETPELEDVRAAISICHAELRRRKEVRTTDALRATERASGPPVSPAKAYGSNEPGNPHPGTFHGTQICATCRNLDKNPGE